MKNLLLILLQQEAQEGGSGWSGMIMIVAMIIIFYFFMIRPQSKKQKEIKKARENMKKGDKVISAGGVHGRIREIDDNIVVMEIAPNVTIRIDKQSVFADPAAVTKTEKAPSKKAEKAEQTASDAGMDLEKAAGKVSSASQN